MTADPHRAPPTPLDSMMREIGEYSAVIVASAQWPTDGTCRIQLDVHTGREDEPWQAWRIICAAPRTSRLTGEWASDVRFETDHPLLAPFTQPHTQLAFHGCATNPAAVVGELWETHREVTGLWYPFEYFLNPGVALTELLGTSGGMLADGPRGFLDAYGDVLRRNSIDATFIGERPPAQWVDGAWQPERSDLAVLLAGESYVIGAEFSAERQAVERLDDIA